MKNFKEVRNVLNMKKLISAGVIAGTLLGATSAFASGGVNQSQNADSNKFAANGALGAFVSQNQTANDYSVLLQDATHANKSNQTQDSSKTTYQLQGALGALVLKIKHLQMVYYKLNLLPLAKNQIKLKTQLTAIHNYKVQQDFLLVNPKELKMELFKLKVLLVFITIKLKTAATQTFKANWLAAS